MYPALWNSFFVSPVSFYILSFIRISTHFFFFCCYCCLSLSMSHFAFTSSIFLYIHIIIHFLFAVIPFDSITFDFLRFLCIGYTHSTPLFCSLSEQIMRFTRNKYIFFWLCWCWCCLFTIQPSFFLSDWTGFDYTIYMLLFYIKRMEKKSTTKVCMCMCVHILFQFFHIRLFPHEKCDRCLRASIQTTAFLSSFRLISLLFAFVLFAVLTLYVGPCLVSLKFCAFVFKFQTNAVMQTHREHGLSIRLKKKSFSNWRLCCVANSVHINELPFQA